MTEYVLCHQLNRDWYTVKPSLGSGVISHDFHTNEELVNGVNSWAGTLVAAFFNDGLQNLVQQDNKSLYVGGN